MSFLDDIGLGGGDIANYIDRPFGTPESALVSAAIITYFTAGLGAPAAGSAAAATATSAGTYAAYAGAAAYTIKSQQQGAQKQQEQQQLMSNQYQAQQEKLMRDEQNRRWQSEISNSWAAYGAQRRSQAMSSYGSGGAALGASTAVDVYLGGR